MTDPEIKQEHAMSLPTKQELDALDERNQFMSGETKVDCRLLSRLIAAARLAVEGGERAMPEEAVRLIEWAERWSHGSLRMWVTSVEARLAAGQLANSKGPTDA